MIQFTPIVNLPYPNRIQLVASTALSYLLPLSSAGALGSFDPRRDVSVYVDGARVTVRTFTFDAVNNRYLLYTDVPFNVQGVVQVSHSMPSPPFIFLSGQTLPGFTVAAIYSANPDDLISSATLTAQPTNALAGAPIQLFWTSSNVDSVRIVGGGFDSGLISTTGFGSCIISAGLAATATLTLTGFNNSISVCSSMATVTIGNFQAIGFGVGFGASFAS
jgi:hypothetical protein